MMGKTKVNRVRADVLFLVLASLMLAGSLRAQPAGPVVLVGLDPASGALVPVDMELVRRSGALRLDPRTGTLTGITAESVPDGKPALLAVDRSTGALVAVDFAPVRRPGEIRIDPLTGDLSPEGLAAQPLAVSTALTLVGFDPVTRTLAPVEPRFVRKSGSYTLDFRAGIISPVPPGGAVLTLDPAAGKLVPVEVILARGSGALVVDPTTGLLSSVGDAAGPPEMATLSLLGIRSDAGALMPVDLEPLYRPGVLAIDRRTGLFSSSGEILSEDPRASFLAILGVQTPTGALIRAEIDPVRRPGEYTVDLRSGALQQVVAPPPPLPKRADAFVFGVGLDVRQMLRLMEVLEEVNTGTTGPDATELAPGIHGYAEYRWKAISFGIEAAYSTLDTEVRFPQGLQTGDLSYTEIGGNVKLLVPLDGPISPYVTFAILRARTEADFAIEGLTEQRTHTTTRDGIGAGFDYWGSPHWGFRVEGLYSTTFEDGDAGEHVRWRLGAMYSPGGVRTGDDGN